MLKLKEIREMKGVLQKELADAIQRTRACISQWELGKTEPSISDLCAIANFLQVTVDELLGREDYATGNVVVQGVALSSFDERLLQVLHMLSPEDQYQVLGFTQALAK